MKCSNCETSNRAGAKFCKTCGAPLAITEAVPSATIVVPEVASDDTLPSALLASAAPIEVAAAEPEPVPSTEAPPWSDAPTAPLTAGPGLEERLEAAIDTPAVANASAVSPALIALDLPVTLAGRYDLTEIIEQHESRIVYRGFDRLNCGQCGALRTDPNDAYCWQCGAEIGAGAARRCQVGDLPAEAAQDSLVVESGTTYWITAEPVVTSVVAGARRDLFLKVGYATDPGIVREMDEDSVLAVSGLGLIEGKARPSVGLFAVADGMGGHDNGQVASRRVIQVLAEMLLPGLLSPLLSGETILEETYEAKIVDAVQEANLRLTTEARAANSDMGSTLTLAFVRDDQVTIANVGDSRTYLCQNGILSQITVDHSMVARLVATGVIQPDEIYTHPRRNEVYRVMGDKPEVQVDIFHCDLQSGDRLVLCCDGVWEMIHDEGIEEVLLTYPDDPQAACSEIVKRSNLAGGEDNISVIVVDVK